MNLKMSKWFIYTEYKTYVNNIVQHKLDTPDCKDSFLTVTSVNSSMKFTMFPYFSY